MVTQEERLMKAADKVTELLLRETKTAAESLMVLYSVMRALDATRLETNFVRKYGLKEVKP